MAFALALASPALAGTRHHSVSHWSDDGGDGGGEDTFSAATLNGTYVFEASGFADDGKAGEVAVLGTLTFDGVSAVTGNLILTRGDNAQNSCNDTFTTGGTYSFTGAPGTPGFFTMQIPATSGSINFGLLVPSTEGNKALAIESDNTTPLSITVCGAPVIVSMVLKGKLHRIDDGGFGD